MQSALIKRHGIHYVGIHYVERHPLHYFHYFFLQFLAFSGLNNNYNPPV